MTGSHPCETPEETARVPGRVPVGMASVECCQWYFTRIPPCMSIENLRKVKEST